MDNGIEHPAASRVAWEGGSDERIGDHDAVAEPEGRPAEAPNDVERNPSAEARSDDRPGNQERGNDQEDEVLAETGIGLIGAQDTREQGRNHPQQ